MPRFGLRKALDVGRGVKVFLNLQTGATRGEVPDPWGRNPPKVLKRKEQHISRLKKKLKNERQELFRVKTRLAAAEEELAAEKPGEPSPSVRASDGKAGALPDYVIIGAMKGGTSRFYGLLTEHPHIKRSAAKELHYFDRREHFKKGTGWYREHFPAPEWLDGQRTITGEATPRYLFEPRAPRRMARVVPDARLIVLLRNPVSRTYSHYQHLVRNGQEKRTFEEAVEAELAWLAERGGLPGEEPAPRARRVGPHSPVSRSIYVDQLARWRGFFPEEQMLVIKSEDFFKDSAGVLETAQDFLGLPRRRITASTHKTARTTKYEYGPMTPDTRERLEAFFEPHNRRLYDFLGKDFGW